MTPAAGPAETEAFPKKRIADRPTGGYGARSGLRADHIDPGRRDELEQRVRQFGVALDPGELDARQLAQLVGKLHAAEVAADEAELELLEVGVVLLWHQSHPFDLAITPGGADREAVRHLALAGQ